jgi:DNA-binding CsgD family transcriptional regulator
MTDMAQGVGAARAHELNQLGALSERAAAGQGAVAVVTGEPGIGKTWLVHEALACWKRRGFETYLAAAWEMEQRRPFGVIADALRLRDARDPRLAEIGRLLHGDPGEAGLPQPAGVEFQVAERVVEYVEDRVMNAPVAMVLEDLQWADTSSLMALGWLAREGAQLPLLLVCTVRPDPGRPEVGALVASLRRLGAARLELGPLSDREVGDLVAGAAGGPPGGRLLRLVASANGNPLHVQELVAALRADGTLIAGPDGQVEVAEGQLPASLRQTVLHRLAGLPEATVDLLRTASVLGSAFTVAELEVVLSRPVSELAAGLRAAIGAGALVEEDGGLLAFRHELIREALYEDMPGVVRREQHLEAAGLLAGAGIPIERVAAHWVAGASLRDMQAVDWLRRAAREVVCRSPSVAVELLERAQDLCPAGEPARVEIMGELVQPLAWAGRPDELEALRRALDSEGRPEDEMTFRVGIGLAHSLFIQGRSAEAQAAYQRVAASATLGQPQQAMLAAYAALSGAMAGQTAPAQASGQLASGDSAPVTAGIARMAVAVAELNSGRADRAVAGFEALAAEGPADRWGLQLLRAAALLDLDQVEAARTVLRQGARDCVRNGTAARTAIHHHNLVAVEYAAGDFDAALAEHDTGLALAEASGHHWQTTNLGVAAAIAVHRGDLAQAAEMIKTAEDQIASFGPHPANSQVARARYLLAQATGDTRLALRAASEAWQRYAAHGYRSQLTWFGADLAAAALAAGEPGRAADAAAAAEQSAQIAPAVCWKGSAVRARGLADDDPELLLQAVALLRASRRPLYLALALEDAAEALARAGRAGEARPLAGEALGLFAGVGAVTDAARARRRWRAASLRLGARGPRSRPRTGWESLSEGELRVVRLVVEGRTNRDIAARLFITRDTVHTHISHALRKLGLSSRVELAAQAARHGL